MDDAKRNAAKEAVAELSALARGVIGLGTGSTARYFVEEFARYIAQPGRKNAFVCVPTSEATRRLAGGLGIPLLDDEGPWAIDVNVDGADEVSAALDLIKGGGGAHAREKIVNYAARKNVVIVDGSKLSRRLGERRAVPVEVLPFAHATTRDKLALHGAPKLRVRDGAPERTDAGNLLYDVTIEPTDDPAPLDRALHAIPGVVETGLFVGRADVVIVVDDGGVRRITRGV